jgi:Ni/Co efflux regulator RcnB
MQRLLTGALALSLLAGTAAVAQPYDQRQGDHSGYAQQGNDRGGHGQQGYDQRGNDRSREVHARNDDRKAYRQWARGQRLPAAYYQDRGRYIDYRAHHLRAPPRGYRWVEADNNYALVAITTGLIASIVAANH